MGDLGRENEGFGGSEKGGFWEGDFGRGIWGRIFGEGGDW